MTRDAKELDGFPRPGLRAPVVEPRPQTKLNVSQGRPESTTTRPGS